MTQTRSCPSHLPFVSTLLFVIFHLQQGSCRQLNLTANVTVLEEGRPVRFLCETDRPFTEFDVMKWYLDKKQLNGSMVSPLERRSASAGGGAERSLTMVPDRHQAGRVLSCRLILGDDNTPREKQRVLDIRYPPSLVVINDSSVRCMSSRPACKVGLSPGRVHRFRCLCQDSVPACRLSWRLAGPAGSGSPDVALVGERSLALPSPGASGGWNACSEASLKVGESRHTWNLTCLVWYPDGHTLFEETTLSIQVFQSGAVNWRSLLMFIGGSVGVFLVSLAIVYGAFCLWRCRARRSSSPASQTEENQVYIGPRDQTLRHVILRPADSGSADEPETCVRSFPRDRLQLHHVIGEGSFGLVYEATAQGIIAHGRPDTVAVKTLKGRLSSTELRSFKKELIVCMSIGKHPHVISMIGFCTEEEPFLLIFEYAANGNLKAFLRKRKGEWMTSSSSGPPIGSTELLTFAHQIANGMAHLASLKIIHRDLAARNILLDDAMVCKISDFGFARDVVLEDYYSMTSDEALPIRWMALESITENTYTTKSDVWSFAVLLWELITLGSYPYTGMPVTDVITLITKGRRLEKPPHCSDNLYKLMMRCWSQSETRRPDFKALEKALRRMAEKASDYVRMTEFTS